MLSCELLPLVHRHEFARRRPGEELSGPVELGIRILEHLTPLRDPANGPREREDGGKERDGDAERLVDDTRVEVDVRIEAPLDEVVVFERNLLERESELEQLVVL